jgi:hypothetical protein
MKKLIPLIVVLIYMASSLSAQNKPMTNTDILDMVKAGLSENTIVLSVERSPANYDTSTQGLIALSKANVSNKIIDAMVKAQSPAKVSDPPTGNQVSKGFLQESAGTSVVFIDGTMRTSMKRMTPKTKTDTGGGKVLIPVAGLFTKAKSYWVFNDNHADLRTGNKAPQVELGIASDLKASDVIGLIRLEIDKETRKAKMFEIGLFSGDQGMNKKYIVPISLKEVSSAAGITTYVVNPIASLAPGEYALVNNGMYYDFGVDPVR